ncbi:AAA family ATPase [Azospirillum sp. B21]|uniref:AAA family ATPase n=1 Tax=Azospirillum sp. B21 TaxID=2607496 RepID=UPI0011EBF370|nr:AAA family ATPase [Azospirillum sp. B21]KAA0573508.1 AAA family ATPase [Azospirillum sp. B21]
MKLVSFSAKKVHGYLNFDVNFLDDVTFLIGINGSGKTTLVRTIYSLLSPVFLNLSFTPHESALLVVKHNDEIIEISSESIEGKVKIRTSSTKSDLIIPPFVMPSTETSARFTDVANGYYRDFRMKHGNHEVLKLLNSLPTPMFLGLERKSSVNRQGYSTIARKMINPAKYKKNVFAGTLSDSLDDAAELAWQKYREIQAEQDKLRDKLRNSLIMRAFDFIDTKPYEISTSYPSNKERDRIEKQRNSVRSTLLSLGLSEEEVGKGIDPFFRRVNSIIQSLPAKPIDVNEIIIKKDSAVSRKEREATLNWIVNKWQFDRIGALADVIDEFVSASRDLYSPIEDFLETINPFFEESGKNIIIDRFGMRVAIGEMEPRDLETLSSGEQQLVVLLTHLAFNPAARRANVLIIDEPEISLHIAWQEMFVDALLKSSPETQFILATHSPSIILERDDNCRDLI